MRESKNIHVHGGSSQALTGEIGLSEIQNVFAEVFICPERIKLLQKSMRGTHFEATVARFEFSWEIRGKPGGSEEGNRVDICKLRGEPCGHLEVERGTVWASGS